MVDDRKAISVRPGDAVQFENVHNKALVVAVTMADGAEIRVELAPGQRLDMVAGTTSPTITLRYGDEGGLRVIE